MSKDVLDCVSKDSLDCMGESAIYKGEVYVAVTSDDYEGVVLHKFKCPHFSDIMDDMLNKKGK
jgi:hypothetical protein